MLHARVSISDFVDVERWAVENDVSVASVVRDMIRRERERREWAQRDNMAQVESAAASTLAERAA